MYILALIVLLHLAWASPTTPLPRIAARQFDQPGLPPTSTTSQLDASSSTSATPSSSSTNTSSANIVTTIIIPVAVLAGAFIAFAIIICFRKSLVPWARKVLGMPALAGEGVATGGNVTAEQLASATPPRRGAGAATTGRGGAAGRGARRSRRGVRRTDSGISVKTLPAYSKEAGDEELVLVRRQSQRSGMSEDSFTDEEEAPIPEEEEPVEVETQPLRRSSQRSTRSQQETTPTTPVDDTQEIMLTPHTSPTPHSAPVGNRPGPLRSLSGLSRRGWGEAPTYLEAMSSPSHPPDVEHGTGDIPLPRTRTTSGFRDLLARAGMSFSPPSFRQSSTHTRSATSISMLQRQHRPESSTSLLLQPQMSRISTQSATTTNTLTPNSPWGSTHSLQISSPVPNTAVRASFDSSTMPRAGLNEMQMKFLSSSEAVNLVGVKLGDVPPGKRRRRSEVGLLADEGSPARSVSPGGGGEGEVEPPSWDEVDGERRTREAEMRRNLGRPSNTQVEMGDRTGDGDLRTPADEAAQSPDAPEASTGSRQLLPLPTLTTRPSLSALDVDRSTPAVQIEPPTPTISSFPK